MLSLNAYFDKCWEIIATFDDFTIQHIFRDENTVVNGLAQQASGFRSNREKLYVLEKSDILVCHSRCSSF
jgi:Mlc titration factor MtfA (ptsG expression regulator)